MKKLLIQFRVLPDKKKILKKHAKEEKGITLDALMNMIIDDYMKRNKVM